MNGKERIEIKEVLEKIKEVEAYNMKLYYRLEKVLGMLEDDPKSNSKGLISKVNDLDVQVEKLIVMNTAIKRVSVFVITVVGGLATYAMKLVFFK
jgi:hypothetical protein